MGLGSFRLRPVRVIGGFRFTIFRPRLCRLPAGACGRRSRVLRSALSGVWLGHEKQLLGCCGQERVAFRGRPSQLSHELDEVENAGLGPSPL